MLDVPELWDTCEEELLTWNGTSARRKCVRVNKDEQSWKSEEHLDIIEGDAEFGVCLDGFQACIDPIFPHYSLFSLLWNSNGYPVPFYVGKYVICFLILILQRITVKKLHKSQTMGLLKLD